MAPKKELNDAKVLKDELKAEIEKVDTKEEINNNDLLYFFEAKNLDAFKKATSIFLNLGYHYSEKIDDELWYKNKEDTYILGDIDDSGEKNLEIGSTKSKFFTKDVLLKQNLYKRIDFRNYIGKFGITIDDCNNVDIIDIKNEFEKIKIFEEKNNEELQNLKKDLDSAYDYLEMFIKYGKKDMAVKTKDYIKIITEKMIDIKLREI